MKHKIGDKVKVKSLKWYNENKDKYGYIFSHGIYFVPRMSLFCGCVMTINAIDTVADNNIYYVEENACVWTEDMFEKTMEETSLQGEFGLCENKINGIFFSNENYSDKVELCMGNDYEIVVEGDKTYAIKKKPKYPTTYEECCGVLRIAFAYTDIIGVTDKEYNLYLSFIELIRCRDAYWKIAGEQMGLDKSWEPDWEKSDSGYVYCIVNKCNNIGLTCEWIRNNYILVFPTVEMRDAFFENFKDLIEKCKNLL